MELTEKREPFKYEDKETGREFVLDFNRETIEFAEARGFDWDLLPTRPMTMTYLAWYLAHRRYYPRLSKEKTDKLLDARGGIKPSELAHLKDLYQQCFAPLIADEDGEGEEAAKNA